MFDNIVNSIGGVPLGGLLDGRRSSIYCVTGTCDCHNIRDCILPSWLTWSMFLFQHPVSYDDKEMTLNWHKTNPVTVSESIQIPSYTLSHHRWYSAVEEFTTGERLRFWCLYLELNHNNNHYNLKKIFPALCWSINSYHETQKFVHFILHSRSHWESHLGFLNFIMQ